MRTASWFIGQLRRFGSRLFVCTGANHTWWVDGDVLTNPAFRPVMKLPAQSSELPLSADSTVAVSASSGKSTSLTAGGPLPTFHGPPQ